MKVNDKLKIMCQPNVRFHEIIPIVLIYSQRGFTVPAMHTIDLHTPS